MHLYHVPVIPEGYRIVFLAEGAANIVYRILPPSQSIKPTVIEEYGDITPPPTEIEMNEYEEMFLDIFDNKLLRLRKDLPTTLPVSIAQTQWQLHIKPLFPHHQIVHQTLVHLKTSTLVENLNRDLYSSKTRASKRQGVCLANDPYGLLVTDMTATPTTKVLEFKPKWLLPSPSAPKGSVRCRQCAITARKNNILSTQDFPSAEMLPTYCPLDLTSTSRADISRAASLILGPTSSNSDLYLFTEWLTSTPLLDHLKTLQQRLDPLGPLNADAKDINYRLAMTLRDCTVFLRSPIDGDGEVEARVGDLDVKSEEKGEYWRKVELELIEEGWYEGRDLEVKKGGENGCRVGRTV